MASTIVTKNSSTASAVPVSGDLTQGELAVNVTDKRLFTKNSGGTVVELGINPSSLTVSAADATFYGVKVGRGAGAVSTNTAVGASALAANTSGAFNTGIGANSLKVVTSGATNTATGHNSLQANTTGSSNAAFGQGALELNTTGANNTAVGYNALQANTTASNNTAVGYQAGYAVTTGANNFIAGYQAGNAVTTGFQNTILGAQAGQNLTTGQDNVYIGYRTVYNAASTGSYNVALGNQALYSNTTTSSNTAVGYQAGYSLSTGNGRNTFLGIYAGYLTTGADNTFVGHATGYNTTGSYNTFIGVRSPTNGTSAGQSITTGSYNTIIGAYSGNQGGLDIRTSSNYIVLSDGDGNPRGFFDAGGAFIINATAKVSATTYSSIQGSTASANLSEWKDTGTSYATNNYYQVYYNSSNSVAGGIAHNAAGTVAFNTSSDARLKENIVDAPSVLDKVIAAKVRSYDWKEDKHHVEYGFIAQELYECLPEAVGKGDDADEINDPKGTWQIEYGRLTPMLVKAIQELKSELDSVKAELATLKGN